MRRLRTVSSWRLVRVVLCVAIALIAAPSVWAYWPSNPPALPAQGGKYTDPSYGTTVMRVTDASDGGDSYGTVYGYWPTFSKNNGHIIIHNDTDSTPYLQHFDPVSFLLVGSRTPLFATNPPGGNTPRHDDVIWSGVSPTVVFCHDGLKLWSYDVDSGVWTLIKDFAGAGLPSGAAHLAQMSRSIDDDVFAFDTQDANWNRNGYAAWKRSTNQLLVSVPDPGVTHDEVQLDKTGRYLRATMYDDTNVIWDLNLGTNTTLTDGAPDYAPGHADHGTGTLVNYTNVGGWYLFRSFATPHTWSTVYDWGNNWSHDEDMSYLADDENWILISTFEGSTPPDDYLRSEVFKLRVDGSQQVQHICHTYSHNVPADYYTQPRANISRDGKYAAFTSNFANQGRKDMFIVQIPGGTPQPPVANFTGNPTSGYIPLTVAFTDSSTNSPTSWSWNFGDSSTSTAQSPSHQYTSAGSYTVSLRATNVAGYDDEVKTNYITASTPPAPVAAFSGTPTSGTAPLAVTFTDSSTNNPTSWSWNFGDSSTSTTRNPSHTYNSAGSYTVSLRATNASGYDDEVKTNYITVQAAGSTPTFVAAGAVAANAAAITPALPAGIASNDILLLFLETANEAISIANQNGGTWTEVTNSPQGTGSGAGSGATRLTVFWSRYNGTQGAPTTSDSGNHQLGRVVALRGCATSGNPWDVTAGGVDATVDTSGAIPGATTTVANTLVVAALATALPDADGTADFSAWTNANLTSLAERTDNTSSAGNGGGLGITTGVKATAGAYGATTVTCATAAKKGLLSIALKPGGGGSPPVAAFSGTPTSGTAPLSVAFTDSSTNTPTSWSWNFGDSSTSTSQNPSHSYAAGTYTVSLRATNAYGYDDEVKTNYITATVAPPVAAFTGTPTSGTAPLAVTFTDTSTGSPTSWSWNFGDSATSTAQHPSHTYNGAGNYTVSLRATNAGGYDDEVKTAYIAVGVYSYPSSWETSTDNSQVTLISGTLADLQSSNDVYMNFRCNTSSQKSYLRYVFTTGYTPSQVNKINVEFELHGTSATTPVYNFLLAKVAGGTTSMYSATWTTTDSWMNWETTAVSTYMTSGGLVYISVCGCPQNTTNYNTYFDTVRLKLTLN